MNYRDYYNILGVEKSASEKDIKRAYRQLAREFHPDKNPDDATAEEKFKEINEAYEVLGNPDNRSKYDQLGSNYQRYQQMGGSPNGFDFSQWAAAGGRGGSYQSANIDLGDLFGGSGGFSEFFSTVFGGRMGGQGPGSGNIYGGHQQARNQAVGQNIEQNVDITLEEAYRGTSRTFAMEGGEQFTAKIPKGAKTGTKVRLRGKGGHGPAGRGDLLLVMNVHPDQTFERDGDNLLVDVSVDVVMSVLGGKVSVPTMSGPVKLTIPPGSQGGQTFRLKGRGMPSLRNKGEFGDLMATVRIIVPKELSEEERRLYEQLAELSENAASSDQ